MKKDIEWAKKEIKELMTEESQNYPHDEMIEKEIVLGILDQLDESEKPVIPQFVADWFEKNKDLTFIEAMDELFWDHHDEKMVEFLISEDNEHIRENQELLMKVWLYAD